MNTTNKKQFTLLVQLMEKDTNLANGVTKRTKKNSIIAKWFDIATKINQLGPPSRDAHGWSKVWQDLKFRTYKKLKENGISSLSLLEYSVVKITKKCDIKLMGPELPIGTNLKFDPAATMKQETAISIETPVNPDTTVLQSKSTNSYIIEMQLDKISKRLDNIEKILKKMSKKTEKKIKNEIKNSFQS